MYYHIVFLKNHPLQIINRKVNDNKLSQTSVVHEKHIFLKSSSMSSEWILIHPKTACIDTHTLKFDSCCQSNTPAEQPAGSNFSHSPSRRWSLFRK